MCANCFPEIRGVTLVGTDPDPRLTDYEVELLFRLSVEIHDHFASRPAQPIFWTRSPEPDRSDFAN